MKWRKSAFAILAFLALAGVFCLVPLRELSGRNMATVALERVTMPKQPRVIDVKPPEDVLQFMDAARAWHSARNEKARSKEKITWEELANAIQDNAPMGLESKAVGFMNDSELAPEIRLYMLWWLKHMSGYVVKEEELAQFLSSEFIDQLKDRSHCVLLAEIISSSLLLVEVETVWLENSKGNTYSKIFSEQLREAEPLLLRKAAGFAPQDAFSKLLELQANYEAEQAKMKENIWFSTDDEKARLSRVFWPSIEQFLGSRGGWLVAEPKWFAYLTLDDEDDPSPYFFLSEGTLTTLSFAFDIMAGDSVNRKDWKRVLVLSDAIEHLSVIYPEKEILINQGMLYNSLLMSIPDDVGTANGSSEFKTLKENWKGAMDEFSEKAFSGLKITDEGIEQSNPKGAAANVAEQARDLAFREGGKKLREFIARFKRLIGELDAAPLA